MDWGVDEDQVLPSALLETIDRAFPAVRAAVIDDHEHALRRAAGLDAHELLDQLVEQDDPVLSPGSFPLIVTI